MFSREASFLGLSGEAKREVGDGDGQCFRKERVEHAIGELGDDRRVLSVSRG